jgi:hypothetical protein
MKREEKKEKENKLIIALNMLCHIALLILALPAILADPKGDETIDGVSLERRHVLRRSRDLSSDDKTPALEIMDEDHLEEEVDEKYLEYEPIILSPEELEELYAQKESNGTLSDNEHDVEGLPGEVNGNGNNRKLGVRRTFYIHEFLKPDWCIVWAKHCGKAAANEYCRRSGYQKAVAWRKAENVGATPVGLFRTVTQTLGGGEFCSGDFCDSFEYITCEDRTPGFDFWDNQRDPGVDVRHRYNKPKFHGSYLDICLLAFEDWKYCGQKAADSFCRWKGLESASNFEFWNDLGYETLAIGDGEKCNGYYCDAFKYIECHRYTPWPPR